MTSIIQILIIAVIFDKCIVLFIVWGRRNKLARFLLYVL